MTQATYYAAARRPRSVRQVRDEQLKVEVLRVWQENRRVYGADEVWTQLRWERITVASCTVERLIRALGIAVNRRCGPRQRSQDHLR